jgi:hypothetical protein
MVFIGVSFTIFEQIIAPSSANEVEKELNIAPVIRTKEIAI